MTEDLGFITSMTETILEHIPANREWAEANAVCLLSTAIGPGKYIRSPYKPLKLNTMDIMIGPSGLAKKSVVLYGFTYPVLVNLTELIDVDVIMPNRYSIEGMIEWFAKHSSHGAYIKDELATIFKDTGKTYLADNLEFISEMYDGTIQKRFTRKTKLEQTAAVYVPILAATTPYLYRLMKPSFFVQGTGNRPRYELYSTEDKAEDFDWDFSKAMELRKNEKLKEHALILKAYYESPVEAMALSPEAEELWTQFTIKTEDECEKRYDENPFDMVYTYNIRSPERVLKYSALRRLSLFWKTIAETRLPELAVTPEDMQWAIERERKSVDAFHELLRQWKVWGRKEEEITSKRDVIWQLCSVLASAPNRMLNSGQWKDSQDLVSDSAFYSYKRKAHFIDWVRKVRHDEITNESERKRLGLAAAPNVVVWTVTKEWLNV